MRTGCLWESMVGTKKFGGKESEIFPSLLRLKTQFTQTHAAHLAQN